MKSDCPFFTHAARIMIQVELKKRDLGYRELTDLLNKQFGARYDARNIKNKIGRGTFSASFFLMVLSVLGRGEIPILEKPRVRDCLKAA